MADFQENVGPEREAAGGGDGGGSGNAADLLRAAWVALKPNRSDYGEVFQELTASKLIGEGTAFDSGAFVPVTRVGHLKPPSDAFLSDLKITDQRSAKE